MKTTRRDVLRSALWLSAFLGSGSAGAFARAAGTAPRQGFKRIATEESFMTKEVFGSFLELLADHPESEPGFAHFYETALGKPGELVASLSSMIGGENTADLVDWISQGAAAVGSEASITALARQFDLGTERLRIMDETGVAAQVVSLGSPGVQVFETETATALARGANDQLAAAIQANPTRLAGLAAIAPQSPDEATRELERAVKELGVAKGENDDESDT